MTRRLQIVAQPVWFAHTLHGMQQPRRFSCCRSTFGIWQMHKMAMMARLVFGIQCQGKSPQKKCGRRKGAIPEDPAAIHRAAMQWPNNSAHTLMRVSIVQPKLESLIRHQQHGIATALCRLGQGRGKGEGGWTCPYCQSIWTSQKVKRREADSSSW